jgi:hypothetical protein
MYLRTTQRRNKDGSIVRLQGPSGTAPAVDENAGRISGDGVAAQNDVGIAALLEVRIEDRFAGRASVAGGGRQNLPTILQATSTATCVVYKPLILQKRVFDPGSSWSASLPLRDILFPPLISGRNPAEGGHSSQIVRTTRTPR